MCVEPMGNSFMSLERASQTVREWNPAPPRIRPILNAKLIDDTSILQFHVCSGIRDHEMLNHDATVDDLPGLPGCFSLSLSMHDNATAKRLTKLRFVSASRSHKFSLSA